MSFTAKKEYEKKPDSYCEPSYAMSSTNLNAAKKECDGTAYCRRFHDWKGNGNSFFGCYKASIRHSKEGSVLYQLKYGNIHIYVLHMYIHT